MGWNICVISPWVAYVLEAGVSTSLGHAVAVIDANMEQIFSVGTNLYISSHFGLQNIIPPRTVVFEEQFILNCLKKVIDYKIASIKDDALS